MPRSRVMHGTATIGRIGLAIGVLMTLIAAGFLGWRVAQSDGSSMAASRAKAIVELPQPTPSAGAGNELGTAAVRTEATPSRGDENEVDEGEGEPDDSSWRVLGAPALEQSRERPTRGFVMHRLVHFTFDDGPHPEHTPRLLDALGEYGVHATFFVVGRQLGGPNSLERRALIQRMEDEGHTVAVHTNAHPDLSRMSAEQIGQDLDRVETSLEAIIGYRPGIFRPPFGRRSAVSNSVLRERGYTQVLWNMPPEENARSSADILRNFQRTLDRMDGHPRGPGGIVIMHDPQSSSVDAFPSLIEEIHRRNCALLNQEGEELWVVADDLRPFLLHDGEVPDDLIEALQSDERDRAAAYCVTSASDGEVESI